MKKTILASLISLICTQTQAQNFESAAAKQLSQGNVSLVHNRNILGQGIKIGVIDQGFDLTHADFSGKILAAKNFYSGGSVTWGTHGTAMASVAAANKNNLGIVGVAPSAQLLLAQVGPGGTSSTIRENSVYAALDWISQQGAQVINLSFGASYDLNFRQTVQRNAQTGIYFSHAAYGANYGASNSVINYYRTATDRGSILVAAAGNQGLAYSEFPAQFATRTNASGQLVLGGRMIIVGSVNANNVMSSFSNRAGHLCQNAQGLICRDPYLTKNFFVVAPGQNVLVSQPNQLTGGKNTASTMSGTSPAAAYVSGGIALIRQTWPQLRPEQIVGLVLTTTKDLGAPGIDDVYGRGLVDFDRASRPQGSLVIAQNYKLTGTAVSGTALAGTVVAMPSGLARNFRSSSVLQNAQVVDEIGRNYTANLTETIIGQNGLAMNPDSPWLGYLGFQQVTLPFTKNTDLTVLTAAAGTAIQANHYTNFGKYFFQFGGMTESQGFLGNQGHGGLSLGSSNTNWALLGVDIPVSESTNVIAQYGQARTQVINDPMSMIAIGPNLVSESWRLAIKHNNMTVNFGIPVSIRHGNAQVTAVVDYTYQETQDGIQAVPVVRSEQVNLRSPVQEYNIGLNYRQNLAKTGYIHYNLVQRFNTGGVAGKESTFAGVNFTWIQ